MHCRFRRHWNCSAWALLLPALVAGLLGLAERLSAEQPRSVLARVPDGVSAEPAAGAASAGAAGRFRRLAPGVLTVVAPVLEPDEAHSRHDLVELLKVDPNYEWAKNRRFEHALWGLEFSFKPVRFIELELPDRDGRLSRKQVWYMVYRVRNPGPQEVRFVPRFRLAASDVKKLYPETLLPIAASAIRRREDPARRFLNSVEITGPIPPGQTDPEDGLWGYVTWLGVDPRTDRFAVLVGGLTNAYRWEDTDAGRRLETKTLELNFWRPGDAFYEHEAEIRLGSPEGVDYRWVYR